MKRIGSSSCLIAAASLGHAPLHAIRPASDKEHYVDFDVCALTAAAFCTGTVSLDMAFGHTTTLLQDNNDLSDLRILGGEEKSGRLCLDERSNTRRVIPAC